MNKKEKILQIKSWLGSGSLNIFGLPFAGKDTQGLKLAETFNGVLLSGGDILRHSKDNAELQEAMASGGIISSKLFKSIVIPYLDQSVFKGQPLILSEVGRLVGEDEVVMEATQTSGHPTKAVILLSLDDVQIWDRFAKSQESHDRGAREDDKAQVLQARLDNYYEKVMPVIERYRSKGLLIQVDGSRSRDEVFDEIIDGLYTKSLDIFNTP